MGRVGVVLIVCLFTMPLMVLLFGRWPGALAVWQNAAQLTAMGGGLLNVSRQSAAGADELFGSLLSPGFDRCACLSRYQSPHYYKRSPYAPSPHLLQKLRDYEALHSRCGPGTPPYAKSVDHLRSGSSSSKEDKECNYLVWIPYNGLGNRMLSLISTFLYALLTDRVLLVHSTDDFTDLFCEPFPGVNATWVLPPEFPVADISRLGVRSNQSYGNLLAGKKIDNDPTKATAQSVPPYVYLHLAHDLRRSDRLFYCNDDQLVLAKVNWLLLQSDYYFVPALYDMAEFEGELRRLFPAKESVSHLLGRYLLHPSNFVWGMITGYYHTYMAQAEERIGVQIRIFSWASIPVDDMYNQIMACSRQEHILPEVVNGDAAASASSHGGSKSKAILIASLQADYYDRIKSTYYEHAAKGGGMVGVFQPSHEEQQIMGQRSHNQKALAEIFLLSFSDVLLTTGISTFRYMSSSLAGLRPTMLMIPKDGKVPEPPCVRAVSMEPCFHMTPDVECQGKAVNKEELSHHVKKCEDVGKGIKRNKGIKLFD
ncbi:galactoside 2-alpha-L-fucosyltransferase-like [Triticum aestivum]|nr:galactoside 2-alpha-L-fucosyltransferase-like [Triticum aestivum]